MQEDPKLTKEHEDAIQGFVDLIGDHPKAYQALAKSYGAPVEHDHETMVAQAMHLMQSHPDFETRFEKEVATVKGFDIKKIFEGIKKAFQTVGKIFAPIVNAIKKAVQKHKDAKAGIKPGAGPKMPIADPGAAAKRMRTIYTILGVAFVVVTVIVVVLFVDDEKPKKAAA